MGSVNLGAVESRLPCSTDSFGKAIDHLFNFSSGHFPGNSFIQGVINRRRSYRLPIGAGEGLSARVVKLQKNFASGSDPVHHI